MKFVSTRDFRNRPAVLRAALERRGQSVLAPPLPVTLPDPDDLPILEVAVAGGAELLVTGNSRHFQPLAGAHAVRVLAPAELVSEMTGR